MALGRRRAGHCLVRQRRSEDVECSGEGVADARFAYAPSACPLARLRPSPPGAESHAKLGAEGVRYDLLLRGSTEFESVCKEARGALGEKRSLLAQPGGSPCSDEWS